MRAFSIRAGGKEAGLEAAKRCLTSSRMLPPCTSPGSTDTPEEREKHDVGNRKFMVFVNLD